MVLLNELYCTSTLLQLVLFQCTEFLSCMQEFNFCFIRPSFSPCFLSLQCLYDGQENADIKCEDIPKEEEIIAG